MTAFRFGECLMTVGKLKLHTAKFAVKFPVKFPVKVYAVNSCAVLLSETTSLPVGVMRSALNVSRGNGLH